MAHRNSPAPDIRRFLRSAALLLCAALAPLTAPAQTLWQEGVHYETVVPAVPISTPGKIEVTEVFSYGCPFCYQAHAIVAQLKASLPAYAQMTYVHASFNSAEVWPMFQRAFLTAQSLGIAEANHQALFDAIWKTGELAIVDPATGGLVKVMPTLAHVARFYAQHSKVKEADFLKLAQSPQIDAAVQRSDELVKAYRIGGTPSFVINGKYRTGRGLRSWDELIQMVNYLVALEQGRSGG
jgi:thiol:disulfide interchange protein DsbA